MTDTVVKPIGHLYEYTPEGPEGTSPIALCGHEPKSGTTNNGGWREREQQMTDCAECFDIARKRWGL